MAGFELACQESGIRLFVLPPHSPKLNGHVERANPTHANEFWECHGELDLPLVRAAAAEWEQAYNRTAKSRSNWPQASQAELTLTSSSQ